MKRLLAAFGLIALLAFVAMGVVAFGGFYEVAADDPHWPMMERSIEWLRMRAVSVRASGLPMPAFDAQAVKEGARDYDEMCAGCHLAPGNVDRTLHDSLYPRPPDLTKVVVAPREAFWTIKHGIKMTGMAAWGRSHDDKTIWSIVAFLQKLPGMSESSYRELVEATHPRGGAGHAQGNQHTHRHEHAHPGELPAPGHMHR